MHNSILHKIIYITIYISCTNLFTQRLDKKTPKNKLSVNIRSPHQVLCLNTSVLTTTLHIISLM